jgi:hypothetical protein
MLEQPELLIGPWTPDAGADTLVVRKRLILAASSGQYLGMARALRTRAWFSWLKPSVLQVLETEDASLLMTIYPPHGWRRTCDIYDSEERRVGFAYRHGVWESSGRRLATMEGNVGAGRFLSPTRTELAAFEPRPEGIVLAFRPAVAGKPFARMLLLATVLVSGSR